MLIISTLMLWLLYDGKQVWSYICERTEFTLRIRLMLLAYLGPPVWIPDTDHVLAGILNT